MVKWGGTWCRSFLGMEPINMEENWAFQLGMKRGKWDERAMFWWRDESRAFLAWGWYMVDRFGVSYLRMGGATYIHSQFVPLSINK